MAKTRYRTVFLDAGGVMITPNFPRLAEALARRGIIASVEALAGAEPAREAGTRPRRDD